VSADDYDTTMTGYAATHVPRSGSSLVETHARDPSPPVAKTGTSTRKDFDYTGAVQVGS
jgi:hypothetical protein